MAAEKPKQLLELNPSTEITFEGPFDRVVTSYLELNNPTEEKICFKVKTTAPRRYCVRPNSGIVNSHGKQKIAIMLQPIDQDNQSERSKHKFMVQSIVVKDDNSNTDEVWKEAAADSIMDSKLRCVFKSDDEKVAPAPSSVEKSKSNTTTTTTTAAATSSSQADTSQPKLTLSQKVNQPASSSSVDKSRSSMDSQPTPSTRSPKAWGANTSIQNLNRSELRNTDKSVASSHNLTASFLQPISDDHKIVLVSLLMLIIGVILGKYII